MDKLFAWETKLIKAGRKTVHMRFATADKLIVRYPKFLSEQRIWQILKEKVNKILKLKQRFEEFQQIQNERKAKREGKIDLLVNKADLTFLGQNYQICLSETAKQVFLEESEMDQVKKIVIPQNQKKILVQNWLLAQAEKIFQERLEFYSQRMDLKPSKISFKNLKSKWGSCSKKAVLILNNLLIQAPLPIIDYVIIHELCHLREFNHSKKFWLLVEKFDPQFKEKRLWLNKNGSFLLNGLSLFK